MAGRKIKNLIPRISADVYADNLISGLGLVQAFEATQESIDGLTYAGTDRDNITFRMENLDPRGQKALRFLNHARDILKKRLPPEALTRYEAMREEKKKAVIDRLKRQQLTDDRANTARTKVPKTA